MGFANYKCYMKISSLFMLNMFIFYVPVRLNSASVPLSQVPLDYGLCRLGEATMYDPKTYGALCRGEGPLLHKLNITTKDLYCRLDSGHHHPLLLLQPVKAEHLTHHPDMWLYHDIITAGQAHTLRKLARSRLSQSPLEQTKTQTQNTAVRNSRTAWIFPRENRRLMNMAAALTGMDMSKAEPMQVVYYEKMGFYKPHYDPYHSDNMGGVETLGNRKATFLFYLNDVKLGGYTAFPCAGVAVKPSLGQGVLWYNQDDRGRVLPEAIHGACATREGEKWAANWWIRDGKNSNGQTCSTLERRRFFDSPRIGKFPPPSTTILRQN